VYFNRHYGGRKTNVYCRQLATLYDKWQAYPSVLNFLEEIQNPLSLATVTLRCYNSVVEESIATDVGKRAFPQFGARAMDCKYCGTELPTESNPRRAFCNDAHKQAYWRQQHQQDQSEALLAEVEQLRTKVSDQAQEIEAQAEEIARLRTLLDIERRYLSDTTARTFKAWLRKQPSRPWRDRFLSDQLVPSRGSRAHYEAHMRRLHCSDEEITDFVRLWKLMLLERP